MVVLFIQHASCYFYFDVVVCVVVAFAVVGDAIFVVAVAVALGGTCCCYSSCGRC